MGKKTVDYNEFGRIWQTSTDLAEVVERAGVNVANCSQRASRMRQAGIPLKKFTKPKGDPFWREIGKRGGASLHTKPKGFEAMTAEQRIQAGSKGGQTSRKLGRIRRPRTMV